jgi:pyruvate dehydrogenase E1 component beta subunit
MASAVRDTLAGEMRRDESIVVLGSYVRSGGFNGGITSGLFEDFGDKRVIDTPTAEAALAGVAAGLAAAGMRPFVDVGNLGFALSLLDQVSNQVAKARYTFDGRLSLPAVYWFETAYGGWGVHHSQAIYALLAHLPGLKVAVPSSGADAAGQLMDALSGDDPVAFVVHPDLLPRPSAPSARPVRIGQAAVSRTGDQVTIVSSGLFAIRALEAAEKLAKEGIRAEVIDLRSLVPLDWETVLVSVEKTGRAAIYDQGHYTCGMAVTLAAGIQERLFGRLSAPVGVVATADVPVPYSVELESEIVPTVDRLIIAVRKVVDA